MSNIDQCCGFSVGDVVLIHHISHDRIEGVVRNIQAPDMIQVATNGCPGGNPRWYHACTLQKIVHSGKPQKENQSGIIEKESKPKKKEKAATVNIVVGLLN